MHHHRTRLRTADAPFFVKKWWFRAVPPDCPDPAVFTLH